MGDSPLVARMFRCKPRLVKEPTQGWKLKITGDHYQQLGLIRFGAPERLGSLGYLLPGGLPVRRLVLEFDQVVEGSVHVIRSKGRTPDQDSLVVIQRQDRGPRGVFCRQVGTPGLLLGSPIPQVEFPGHVPATQGDCAWVEAGQ